MTTKTAISPNERRAILRRGLRTTITLATAMGAALFLSAGRLDWPEAWIFIAAFLVYFISWIAWGLRHNPELLRERAQSVTEGGEAWDRALVRANQGLAVAVYVVSGLDAVRYGWSAVPAVLQAAAFVLIVLGYLGAFWALSSNPFASGVVRVQTERGHQVAHGGPYRFVRHPMYLAALFSSLGVPLFLGSYWALAPEAIILALVLYRTAREDRTLLEELPGYREYAQEVRYRLVPGLW